MTADRIATALERIADALEGRPVPRNPNHTGLSAAWDACEVAEEGLGGSGAARLSGDPLDESDHRPRHDADGDHWTWRRADRWCSRNCSCDGVWTMPEIVRQFGPLTFCNCDPTDSDRATD